MLTYIKHFFNLLFVSVPRPEEEEKKKGKTLPYHHRRRRDLSLPPSISLFSRTLFNDTSNCRFPFTHRIAKQQRTVQRHTHLPFIQLFLRLFLSLFYILMSNLSSSLPQLHAGQ